jgi:TonB family protein
MVNQIAKQHPLRGSMFIIAMLAAAGVSAQTSGVPSESSSASAQTPQAGSGQKNCAPPRYPIASAVANEQGTTRVKFLIVSDGSVAWARVDKSSGHSRLDEAAIASVRTCIFKVLAPSPKPQFAVVEYVWRLKD